jgi:hypothetical protein
MHERDIPRWTDHDGEVPAALRDALGAARAEAPTDVQIEGWIAGAQAAVANGEALGSTLAGAHRLWIALGVASVLGLGAFAASQLMRTSQSGSKPAGEPKAAAAPERLQQPVPAPTRASAEPVSEQQPIAAAAPASQQARRSSSVRSKAAPSDPTAEVLLLREAKRALPHAPERAQSLLREHLAKYSQGAFAEERDALRIEGDWLLGRTARARAGLERFRKRYANSPYLRRLEHILVPEDPRPDISAQHRTR